VRALFDVATGGAVVAGAFTYRNSLLQAMRQQTSAWQVLEATASFEPRQGGLLGTAETGARVVAWTQLRLPLLARSMDVDVVHSPAMLAPLRCPRPVVMTIFDLSFRRYPDHFAASRRALLNFLVPRAARRAAAVITFSDHVRQEVIEAYSLDPALVRRTHLGVDHERYSPAAVAGEGEALTKRGIRSPYLLHVGSLNRRKNLPQLLRALVLLRGAGKGPDPQLVLVGGEELGMPGRTELLALVDQLKLRDRVLLTGFLPAAEMAAVYRGAELLVQPSLYEGFGLPVLEAMACGTPVISSNAGSLPEVAGDAAILVDPGSAEQMAAAIQLVLEDQAVRARLGETGIVQSGRFSWSGTAAATLQVYDSVAGTPG